MWIYNNWGGGGGGSHQYSRWALKQKRGSPVFRSAEVRWHMRIRIIY